MGFNWVDLVILLLLVGAGFFSVRIGFLRQVFVLIGFFGGMFLAGWLFPQVLPIKDRTLLMIINCNLVLLAALFAGAKGYDLGNHLKGKLKYPAHHKFEEISGIFLGASSVLIFIWLIAVVVGRMPFYGLSNSANDSFIAQKLDNVLPPVPAIFARFDQLIDPNVQPHIYEGHQPVPRLVTGELPSSLVAVAAASSASVMRVTGFGCGGIISGTGFVVGPNLVATNAHVIAGVKRPIIKSGTKSYEGIPVLFNPNIDFAVLRTIGLNAAPLALNRSVVPDKTAVAITGYPNGNLTTRSGVIRSEEGITGTNIYGLGDIGRETYDVQTEINEGSSGSPLIMPNGEVAGMIFAKSVTGSPGYALVSSKLNPLINKSSNTSRRVSTGACLSNYLR